MPLPFISLGAIQALKLSVCIQPRAAHTETGGATRGVDAQVLVAVLMTA
jgi:hypothetical protein